MYTIGREDSALERFGFATFKSAKISKLIYGLFDATLNIKDWGLFYVECKNKRHVIGQKRLASCIKKASKYQVSVIVGFKFVKTIKGMVKMKEVCAKNKVNVYRYRKLEDGQFTLDLFKGTAELAHPKSVCLIIEIMHMKPARN